MKTHIWHVRPLAPLWTLSVSAQQYSGPEGQVQMYHLDQNVCMGVHLPARLVSSHIVMTPCKLDDGIDMNLYESLIWE